MEDLEGLTILVPESRELDLFARMLENEGATTQRCPLVQILDLEDTAEAGKWVERVITQPFDYLIFMTGEGLRRLLILCDDRKDAFVQAIAKSATVTRGPKPARALREIGLAPTLSAPVPTSQGVLQALETHAIEGKRIGLQLYPGEGGLPLLEALRARGAIVDPVTPYRYESETDSAEVAGAIEALADGRIGMIAFTSSPQIERLFEVAKERGLEEKLNSALRRAQIASVGPVVEAALLKHGLINAIQPQASFHMKPLVRAICDAWKQRRA